jgi:hypothetical protein
MTDGGHVVIASNRDERWAYGPFDDPSAAEYFAERMGETNQGSSNEVADLLTIKQAVSQP